MAERYVVRSGQRESPLPEENIEMENVQFCREERSPNIVGVKKKKPPRGCILLYFLVDHPIGSLLASTFFRPAKSNFLSSIALHEQFTLFIL
jgi:hypothetical protein